MPTINGRACVIDGKPVDRVYSNGKIVYGRNLLTGTSNQSQVATGGDYLISTIGTFKPIKGQRYTASVDLGKMDHMVVLQEWTMSGSTRVKFILTSTPETAGRHSATFTAPTSDDYDNIAVQLAWTNGTDTGSYAWSKAKTEVGDTASPWTPAPQDVMTLCRKENNHE